MAISTRTIKGMPYLCGDSIIQDQTLLYTLDGKAVNQANATVMVLEDIWKDLKNGVNSTVKTNGKGYWYWEIDCSDTGNEDDGSGYIKVKVEAPKPGPELFNYDFEESDSDSPWTKFWKAKMKSVYESKYNSKAAILDREITLPGTSYIDQNGDVVTINSYKITKDTGDMDNLLNNLSN